jgi:hypothetical protein
MPIKSATTKHGQREQAVRQRLNKAIRYVELPVPNPLNLTVWGVFNIRCTRLAAKNDSLRWFKSKTSGSGVQGYDGTTSVRKFAEGQQGAYEWTLDTIEAACADIEEEVRQKRREARSHLTPVSSQENPVETAKPFPADVNPIPVEMLEPDPRWLGVPIPDEFDAAKNISAELAQFDAKTAYRILRYATMRLDEQVVEEKLRSE